MQWNASMPVAMAIFKSMMTASC